VGDVIDGRYRLERRLGKGGMGEVFEVSRLSDDKRFAFKIAREPDGTALARLAREAHVALAVEHENVVRVIDVDVASAGFLYIVMELVEGQPLRPADEAPTPAERTLELLRQLAEGLSALHDAGVVHRDLKPANVLLSEATDGGIRVKIADFGISLPTLPGRSSLPPSVRPPDAAATAEPTSSEHPTVGTPGGSDEQPTLRGRANRRRTTPTPPGIEIQVEEPRTPNSPALTETGVLPGTPAYIAPELLGGRENVSPAADVFAFGVIAYELLAGRRPFDEPPIHALMGRRAPVWPAPLSSNHPLVPAGLGQLVDRCLAPDPRDRPSAREIAQELEARSDRTLRLRAVT
jgi:serine/threonine-protein kinase